MKKVKDEIVANLKAAIEECAYSNSTADDTANDLHPTSGGDASTHGNLMDALRSLVGDQVVDLWIEDGEWPIRPRCTECDSSDITMKDWMVWDMGIQAWVINQYGGCDRTNIHPREANWRNCGVVKPIVWG